MMLSRLPFHSAVVAADVIVMPRSCSCSMKSMVAAPSCTSPILWLLPIIEDALGRRRLAGIDVGHDAEVAVVLDLVRAGHYLGFLRCLFFTSDSARTRGWLPPSGAYLRASSRRFPCCSTRRAAPRTAARSLFFRCARAPPR